MKHRVVSQTRLQGDPNCPLHLHVMPDLTHPTRPHRSGCIKLQMHPAFERAARKTDVPSVLYLMRVFSRVGCGRSCLQRMKNGQEDMKHERSLKLWGTQAVARPFERERGLNLDIGISLHEGQKVRSQMPSIHQ